MLNEIIAEVTRLWSPPEKLKLSEWADKYARLSPESSADTGRWTSYPYQRGVMDALLDPAIEKITWMKSARVGYALSLRTSIPTVSGYKNMADIKEGDILFDDNGIPCNVTYVSPVYENRDCFKITFCDGSTIICDGNHRWFVNSDKALSYECGNYHKAIRSGVLSTLDIFNTYLNGINKRSLYSIPVTKPLKMKKAVLPIPPYTLGLWLGDGHIVSPRITTHKDDVETAEYIKEEGINVTIAHCDAHCPNNRTYLLDIDDKRRSKWAKIFRSVGLIRDNTRLSKLNYKHIPSVYLRSSYEQRLSLLQGIMDSDGTISKSGFAELSITSKQVFDGFCDLLASLGYKFSKSIRYPRKKHHYVQFRVVFKAKKSVPPFRLKRKAEKILDLAKPSITNRRRIVKVEKVDSEPVKCISVDSQNELFLAGEGMIPTHNTKVLNWDTAFHIAQEPCSQLIVQPTVEDASGYSKDEIAPMLRDMPILDGLVLEPRSRDSKNTILKKTYPGGILHLVGANSARGFRRITVKRVKFDEVDGYPATAGHEGDQIKLGTMRSETFWDRKIILGSTPTIAGISRIEKSFKESDQRYRFLPCPFCGHFQVLRFGQIKWPKNEPWNARYECEECKQLIPHSAKRKMDEAGEWRATKPFHGHAGFHIWAGYSYSPNSTWAHIAEEFLRVKKDKEQLKTFTNTVLGETWEEQGDQPEWTKLSTRAEPYRILTVPAGASLLTAGVDTQDNRLEVLIEAWGPGEECWIIYQSALYGDPDRPEVWKQLDELLYRSYKHESGAELRIESMGIDTGGHKTQAVYNYCRTRGPVVFALKGASQDGKPILSRPSKQDMTTNGLVIKNGVSLYTIGTDIAKGTIYNKLKLQTPGPGYIHFPIGLSEEFYMQLTAEKIVTSYNKSGFPVKKWVKTRERNDVLDCKVYSYAAALKAGLQRRSWDMVSDHQKVQKRVEQQNINKSPLTGRNLNPHKR